MDLLIVDDEALARQRLVRMVEKIEGFSVVAEADNAEQALRAISEHDPEIVLLDVRMPEEHAGGKWSLRYQSAAGQSGNLEVDLNFMYRVPLWPVTLSDSYPVGTWQANQIPVIDIHELAAGKLAALLARRQARDLFDSHRILHKEHLDHDRLRTAFVVYGAMNRKDWRTVSIEDVNFESAEVARQLIPTLRVAESAEQESSDQFGARLVEECRRALSVVLPFTEKEKAFLDSVLEQGKIDSTILISDSDLQQRIQKQPLLEWKAANVRKDKGI